MGNHGGCPTRRNIQGIEALNEQADLPRLVFGIPEDGLSRIDPAPDCVVRHPATWSPACGRI